MIDARGLVDDVLPVRGRAVCAAEGGGEDSY